MSMSIDSIRITTQMAYANVPSFFFYNLIKQSVRSLEKYSYFFSTFSYYL